MLTTYFTGMSVGLGLIVAIGAQNAFVLRQGLLREHVFAVCLFCAASDALLIAAGVAGFGTLMEAAPWLGTALRWGGVAFLLWYGWRSFRSAWRGGTGLAAAEGGAAPLGRVLATLAAITWLNPHVWLDTVVFLGTISTRYPGQGLAFAAGAMTGSFLFFFGLGYGARLLAPLFARPRAWQVLDVLIGGTMWSIALSLALG